MAKKTPLQIVRELYGDKEKLVEKLVGGLDRGELSKEELKAKLLAAPNSKLLRLQKTVTEVKEKFGGPDKVVDAILTLGNRLKDGDYREKLLAYTPVQLIAAFKEANLTAKRKAKKAA